MRWPWMAECPCSHGRREGTAGHGWPSVPVAMTRTGRSRLEHRHG